MEGPILEQVGGRRRQQRKIRRYVKEGLAERDEKLEGLSSSAARSVGSDRFQAEMQKKCQERVRESSKPENAAFWRAGWRATIEEVQEGVAKH